MPSFDFGIHYSCQSPEGNFEEVYQKTVQQARTAESLGFSSFSVAEHHFLPDGWVPTPFVILGALAAVTEEARLRTNITLLLLHDPVRVAERAAVLDILSGGAFRLGVSLGWRNEEFERHHDIVGMDEVLIRTHFPGLDIDLAEKSLRITSREVIPHFE